MGDNVAPQQHRGRPVIRTQNVKKRKFRTRSKHLKQCTVTECIECRWIRKRRNWERIFTMVDGRNNQKPWLELTRRPSSSASAKAYLRCIPCNERCLKDGEGTAGCCNVFALGTVDSRNAQACNFASHQASAHHKRNVDVLFGRTLGSAGKCMAGAPPVESVQEALEAGLAGKSPYKGIKVLVEANCAACDGACLQECLP